MCFFCTTGVDCGKISFCSIGKFCSDFRFFFKNVMLEVVGNDNLIAFLGTSHLCGTSRKADRSAERSCQSKIAPIRIEMK